MAVPIRIIDLPVQTFTRKGEFGVGPWPHKAHVASKDVDELRQFIDTRAADEFSEFGHARIVPLRQFSSPVVLHVRPHRRSEEHTSELQSLMRISYAVFCLKKKNILITRHNQR